VSLDRNIGWNWFCKAGGGGCPKQKNSMSEESARVGMGLDLRDTEDKKM
jgi:hypothetical protein